jgi:hypothetical protein
MNEHKTRQTSVKGIVVPEKWDASGCVIGFALQAFDEKEYLVEDQLDVDSLAPMLHKEVEVIGITKRGVGGKPSIRIIEFREIKTT